MFWLYFFSSYLWLTEYLTDVMLKVYFDSNSMSPFLKMLINVGMAFLAAWSPCSTFHPANSGLTASREGWKLSISHQQTLGFLWAKCTSAGNSSICQKNSLTSSPQPKQAAAKMGPAAHTDTLLGLLSSHAGHNGTQQTGFSSPAVLTLHS